MRHSSSGAAVQNRLMAVTVIASLLASLLSFTVSTPASAHHVSASDFFIFAKAVYGKAAETNCDGSQSKQASIPGSDNEIFGRIHSNADYDASGQNNLFHGVVTYGTHDEDCQNVPGVNTYNAGAPSDIDAAPPGVGTGGWPGTLGNGLNADALTFGNDVTQVLGAGAVCNEGTLTTSADNTLDPVADNNKVICSGTGKVQLNVQNASMKITIISHGLIEISGQNASLSPADAGHGILAWTDQDSNTQEFSAKVAGSDFHIGPSIIFTPRSGQDISGSEGSELCIQHIGQGQIKVQGSDNQFGPGACGEDFNPTCAELGDYDHEFRIQPVVNGTYDDPNSAFVVTLTTHDTASGQTVDFSANLPVDAVFVKGGPGGLLYEYNPPVTSANGLHAEVNPSNGTYYGLSHISFCWHNPPVLSELTILKHDAAGQSLGGATFSITPDPLDADASLSVTDNVAPDDNAAAGTIHLSNVEPGTYTVCETAAPAGYIKDPDCQQLTVAAGQNAIFGPWVNTLSAIAWTKLDDETGEKLGGATFTLQGINGTVFGPITVVDNGTNDEDPDAGELLVTGLKLGQYRITETIPPAGYMLPSPSFQDVTLDGDPVTGSPVNPFRDPPMPVLTVVKTPDGATPTAGDAVTFRIVTTNLGPGTATGATLFDDLPEVAGDWAVVANNPAATGWASCSVSSAPHPDLGPIGQWLSCGPESIGQGGARTVTVGVTLQAGDCDNLPNQATADASNTAPASDTGSMNPLCPDIEVEKTPDAGVVDAPGSATFRIVTTNVGDGEARDSTLFDDLPEVANGWAIVANNPAAAGWASCEILDTDHPTLGDIGEWLRCGPETILAGQANTRTVTVSTTVTTDDCGDLPNLAKVSTSNNGTDEDAGEIHVQCPDLDITKSADDPTVNAGDDIGFSITVSNSNAAGTGVADNVTLDDPLPGSLALGVDWSIDAVLFNGVAVADQTLCEITGSPASETLECEFGDLNPGDDYEVQLSSATSAPNGCTNATLPNEATADADNHAAIEANASITVQCPDLDIEKTTTTPEINAGEEASYTIAITNDGDGDAIDVDLVDTLPSGITWSEDSEDCDIDAGVLECLDLTIAAEDGSFSVTLTGIADEDECPSILNRATFTSDNAGSGASAPEGQGTLITVNCPDLEVDKEWVDANGEPTDDPVTAGTTAHFAITVTNNGPGTAFDVVVFDEAPDGTIWTVVDDGGFDCPSTIDDAGDSCTAEAFAPGSATILLSYLTGPEDCGTLTNEVEVSASNEPGRLVDLENADSATAIVECPFLNITKVADEDPIDAGEEASFTITIWNSGPGDALDVRFHDELPAGKTWDFEILSAHKFECTFASSQVVGGEQHMSIGCDLGDLEPSSMEDGVIMRVFVETDREDCGALLNVATVDASNLSQQLELQGVEEQDELTASDTITVFCPVIGLEKANDAVGSVLPGTEVTYTLTLAVDDETESVTDSVAEDVVVIDEMPVGLESPTDISDGGTFDADTRTITWDLGDLPHGDYTLTYNAIVADDVEHGEELVNAAAATSTNSQCPDFETLGDECKDTSVVIPRVPTLVIDKVADIEVITITGPANAPVATPSVVTWTLTYTLTNGPVTNAVITDEVPAGLEYVAGSASDGGVHDEATNTITWTFPTLSESGSVTFQTSVDPETISRTAPTVNFAVIDSDETSPDDGEDSITVRVVPPPQGGNPTPGASLPDTSTGLAPTGEPVNVPVELLAFVFIGSLGALALANVRARNSRR